MTDRVDREDLALALELATTDDRDGRAAGALSPAQAEQIAREVGIPIEEFRRALAEVRANRLGRGRLLGPSPLQSAEATVVGPVTGDRAARAIAEGQAGLPQVAEGATEVAPGIWRSAARGSLVQVTSGGASSRVSAAANRLVFKATTIVGSTGAGGFVGAQLGGLLTSGLMGEVSSTVAVGIAVGGVGGLLSGFAAGVSFWKASARTFQARLHQAVDRMRDTLAEDTADEYEGAERPPSDPGPAPGGTSHED